MQEWMADTCIVFRHATASDKNKIKIQNGVGCMSQLGMTGGTQILNLEAPGCRNGLMYLHELGHAIGLVHEHQLPDRDEYISINFSNVVADMQIWFEKYSSEEVNTYGVPYEYASVMHYGISAFSRDQKKQTIRALDESREQEIGAVRTRKLAFSDIKVVNLMYDCGKNCPPDPTCKTPGYLNKTCHCVCPLQVNCSQENFHLGKGGGWRPVEECRNIWNDTDCEPWAKRGECDRNPVWMKENCRKSCKRCPQDCKNFQNDTDCESRAKNGECKTNQTWMAENCKKACNLCWDDCKNSWNDTECDTWAKNGECSANSVWMRSNCQRSCNSCHDECTNYHNNNECEDWARNGECRKNPKWMTENCRKSCKKCFDSTNCKNPGHKIKLCHCVCPTEYEENSESLFVERWDENAECKNKWKNETECETWALNGECKINKHWMRKNCKKSCMNCTDDCKNIWSDTECENWANTSQCEINRNWMEKHCQQSCSACSNKLSLAAVVVFTVIDMSLVS
ncbi:zinc metalloproteinase nas-13-like [Physella acuta]|uniref:zinc metalloproteinase nas-13-like n=1 Tax=Physella acuta TaxID=109671 RepID=UPI0027DCFA1E|nr:zinc metalloproteinase nas-13-like [Physella acuta]